MPIFIYQRTRDGNPVHGWDQWVSFGGRPEVFFTKYLSLAFEGGFDHTHSSTGQFDGWLRKFTIAPQIGAGRQFFSRPTLRDPEHYQYDLNLRDVAEVWRRGSVIASWLLDLTAAALLQDPNLSKFAGRVSDSGEGRWTIKAAIDEAVPAPVLTASLYERFSSRGEADFVNKLLSAMRYEFGGHVEKPAEKSEAA